MVIVFQVLFVLLLIVLLILFVFRISRTKSNSQLPENYRELLTEYVKFYRQLDERGKEMFDKRVDQFLSAVKITGVNAIVEDIDRLLIAAGSIIPVYSITDWQYINLHEVLVYPGSFNMDFDQEGTDRNIAGTARPTQQICQAARRHDSRESWRTLLASVALSGGLHRPSSA